MNNESNDNYVEVEMGSGYPGKSARAEGKAVLYLRVFTGPDDETPRAGLHAEPDGVPNDGWESGEPLTTAADAARVLENTGGDATAASRALLAIAATRRAFTYRKDRIFLPKNLRVWKTELWGAVSDSFDHVFGEDEEAMQEAAGDFARRVVQSRANGIGSIAVSESDPLDKVYGI